ncbi:MAG: outer membrane protein transport protein [Myxococcota bacterium]|nr:outer membrane protein transport protein [Myxococcota bacterium]
MRKALLAILAIGLLTTQVNAAGFSFAQQGAKATGLGGAVTARINDGSAIFYNPAGITKIKGFHAYIGGTMVMVNASYVPFDETNSYSAISDTSVVPAGYITYELDGVFTLGLGMGNAFGSRLKWEDNHPQAEVIQEIQLKAPTISTVLGWDLNESFPGLSLAAGIDVTMGSLYLKRALPFGTDVASVEAGAQAVGVSGRFGMMVESDMVEGASFGISVRLPIQLDFLGTADFSAPSSDIRGQLPADGEASGRLTLPLVLNAGFAYDMMENFTLSMDISFFGWESYKEFKLKLPQTLGSSDLNSYAVSTRDWYSTVSSKIGLEYTLGDLAVRMGASLDKSPVPDHTLDSSLPDSDRIFMNCGLGYKFGGGFNIDAAGIYKIPGSRRPLESRFRENQPKYKAEYTLGGILVAVYVGYSWAGDEEGAEGGQEG